MSLIRKRYTAWYSICTSYLLLHNKLPQNSISILYVSNLGWTVAPGLAQALHTPALAKSHCKVMDEWSGRSCGHVRSPPEQPLSYTGILEHLVNLMKSTDLGLAHLGWTHSLSTLAGVQLGKRGCPGHVAHWAGPALFTWQQEQHMFQEQ